jgi:cytoskeleton-associated protein 5
MKVAGEKAVSPLIEKLDKLKEAKVREHFERVSSSQSKSTLTNQAAAGNSQKASIVAPKLTAKKLPSTTKAPLKINAAKKKAKPSTTGEAKTAEVKSSEPQTIHFRFTDDSARQYFDEKCPEIAKEMADSNWKVRLAAVQSLSEYLINNNSDAMSAEATVRFLSILPGWKDSNFQVMTKLIDTLEWLAVNCSSFDRAAASLAIPGTDL